jgi:hypothetical protein
MAGGAKQEVSSPAELKKEQNEDLTDEISLEKEQVKMQKVFRRCSGHCASGLVQNNKIGEIFVDLNNKCQVSSTSAGMGMKNRQQKQSSTKSVIIELHEQTKPIQIEESTSDFYIACDAENVNANINQSFFCSNEEDAAAIQFVNSAQNMFFAQSNTQSVCTPKLTLGQNNTLCAQAWALEGMQAFAPTANGLEHVPVVSKERAGAFYLAFLNLSLAAKSASTDIEDNNDMNLSLARNFTGTDNQKNVIPFVTIETMKKIVQGASSFKTIFHRLVIHDEETQTALRKWVNLSRQFNNCGAEQWKYDIKRLQFCGLPVFADAIKIGNKIPNPASLRCVTFLVSGVFSNNDTDHTEVQKGTKITHDMLLGEHLPSLSYCSDGKFGGYIQPRTSKEYCVYLSTDAYPERVDNVGN